MLERVRWETGNTYLDKRLHIMDGVKEKCVQHKSVEEENKKRRQAGMSVAAETSRRPSRAVGIRYHRLHYCRDRERRF